MGDISIIARRLDNGHVQYGWSGNGGYFNVVGRRLLSWYQDPKDVDYLFNLGQTRLIGKKGSEYGDYHWSVSHQLTGDPFWLGNTERCIFDKIAFIDYGYFYDLDHVWYYIVPGSFRIKIHTKLIEENLDEAGYEFNFLRKVEDKILRYVLNNYGKTDRDFIKYIEDEGYDIDDIKREISIDGKLSIIKFYQKYKKIYYYFDDWILIKSNKHNTEIEDIIVKKQGEHHIETCEW